MAESLGFLFVTMQPPAHMEEEFHDWYDTEHVPERLAVKGFLSAQRYVCLEGWPRFAALYDLSHVGVLHESQYQAISGSNYSAWTKRVTPRMHGLYRAEGIQITRPATQLIR